MNTKLQWRNRATRTAEINEGERWMFSNIRPRLLSVIAILGSALLLPGAIQAGSTSKRSASFVVTYPHHQNARFDMDYYRQTHIPLVKRVMKPDRLVLIEGVPRGASPAPYVMIAHLEFASPDALETALANPDMALVRGDVPRFTDIKQVVLFGKTD